MVPLFPEPPVPGREVQVGEGFDGQLQRGPCPPIVPRFLDLFYILNRGSRAYDEGILEGYRTHPKGEIDFLRQNIHLFYLA